MAASVRSRGGFFKARAFCWEKAHCAAAWSLEAPAPDWWAEMDIAWQLDRSNLMSVRELAAFLGWRRSKVHALIDVVSADLEAWLPSSDKNRTKTGQLPDSSRTVG